MVFFAHRGDSAHAPENTLAAFRSAVEQAANGIELDIQLTADNEIIVMHDATLQRTTNGSGYVHGKTLSHIRSLDAGMWFGSEFRGERIPTLREVLEILPRGMILDIEIKPRSGRGHSGKKLARRLIELLKEFHREENVLVTSFSDEALEYVRQESAILHLGFLQHGRQTKKRVESIIHRIDVTWYAQHVLTLTKKRTRELQEMGITVGVFTVNSKRTLRHALHCGVDCIITNDCSAIRSHLRELSASSLPEK